MYYKGANLCPDGALIKLAGLRTLVQEGPARVFESEGDCARAVEARAYKAGDVLVIRNEGPVGGPGMQEMLGVTALIYGQQMGEAVALITDGRFSGRRAAFASAMSRRRRRSAARSRWCATETSCASTRQAGAWTCSSAMRKSPPAAPPGGRWRPATRRGFSPNTPPSWVKPTRAP